MNKTLALISSLAVLAVSAPAFSADSTTDTSKTSASSTDANGTTSTVDQKVKVKTHADGSTDTTVKTDASKDPKGLFNKSHVKSTEAISTDKDGNVVKDQKAVSGKVVDDSTAK